MIDTHCHFDFAENPINYISNNERNKIITIGMTNLPSHFDLGINHIKNYKYIRLALGLHPLLAIEHEKEYLIFKRNIDKTSYIGEIGLDFSREGFKTKKIQIKSFNFVLDCIDKNKKILSIHSRNAERDVFEILSGKNIENVIFHWYSGSIELLSKIIDKNYFFSINSAMINSEHGKKIINNIPKEQIVTETDYPFIKDTDILSCHHYLSNLWKKKEMEVENIIRLNFNKLIQKIKTDAGYLTPNSKGDII
ncbi:hydrolase [Spirochaetia bacterium]|nr:hydrolase [Spirochaetia bacterium]